MLTRLRSAAVRLGRDRRGLSTVEYVIILVLVAAVCIATWTAFGKRVKAWLGYGSDVIDHELTGAAVDPLEPGGNPGGGGGGRPPAGGGGATPGGGGGGDEPKVKRKIRDDK